MNMKIRISTRVVFIFNSFVLKFPIDKRGYLQGKNEYKMYRKYKHLNLLGTLHWEKFGVVCMKKYNLIDDINATTVFETKDLIPEFNFENCDLLNHENWGELDDVKYLIDYGIDESISKMY